MGSISVGWRRPPRPRRRRGGDVLCNEHKTRWDINLANFLLRRLRLLSNTVGGRWSRFGHAEMSRTAIFFGNVNLIMGR